jgi:hypothetical protein
MKTRMAAAVLFLACSGDPAGRLEFRVVEGARGAAVPARVELLDEAGRPWVPEGALPLRFECVAAPLPDWAAGILSISQHLENPHTGTTQFYVDGTASLELPPGRYRLRVFKGIEYAVAERRFEIRADESRTLDVELSRWIDMPASGWYGADDHLHITRLTPEDDRRIAAWMRAEDLHVANLLQMGTVDQFGVTPQHDFGAAGEYRLGDTLLLAGQEHPRTHFLGHTITLGADAAIDLRETYIVYETFWRASQERNGLPGFAHWGAGPARDGLAVDAPRGLVFFLEVLQFEFPHYDVWYELLDLGIRLTPTAGTDFPCGSWSVPGRERFYTRLSAPPTRGTWLEAVRRGRTFVTNGPLLELRVGEAEIGDELQLDAPTRLALRGAVRFDPARDDVRRVELVRNGEPLPTPVERPAPGELRFEVVREVSESAWYALRVSGNKIGEAPLPPPTGPFANYLIDRVTNFGEVREAGEAFAEGRGHVRPSAAHTAPIWVSVRGSPAIENRERARELARASLARLDALEARLADPHVEGETIWDWVPYSDGVSAAHLRRNRPALLRAIEEARRRYGAVLAGADRGGT